ncbi:MAG: hypothetical protein KBB32_05895 [Spirochaetia bacterium]|nr:hypothetical protein [Spirochaetia bacterium]
MRMTHDEINVKHARTGFRDETGEWYQLDNAAIIMPAISNVRNTSLFRMAVTLDHPVRLDDLNTALERVAKRFPYYMVELRRGFFWYYFQPLKEPIKAVSDLGWPCMGYNMHKRGAPLLRVRVAGARIAFEFSHILADGAGGGCFLTATLIEYFKERGIVATPPSPTCDVSAPPDPEEYEDAYHRFYKPRIPIPGPLPRAYHLSSKLLPVGQCRAITGIVVADDLVALAKARKVSVTEFLTAVYLDSLIELRTVQVQAGARRLSPYVSLEVPVNLRRFYKTKSLRNFSLFVLPTIDTRLGTWTLDELAAYVHHYMGIENDERRIATQISRNAGGGRKLVVRLIPLFIKNFFVKILYVALGEGLISGILSNLGTIQMPEELAPHLERFDFLGAPSSTLKTFAALCTWKGKTHIAFGSQAQSRELERLFFKRLVALGLRVEVSSNM